MPQSRSGDPLPYLDYSTWLAQKLPKKVRKLPIDTGTTCPNRDGRINRGGCIYCNNAAFVPSYCRTGDIHQQLEAGKAFFSHKSQDVKYIAYLQAHTGTYTSVKKLEEKCHDILSDTDIVGISIGTRPDCVDTEMLEWLQGLSRQLFVMVEYGIESTNDHTLSYIHRGHDFACAKAAIEATANRGIYTCGHVILGLPGEDFNESLRQAPIISSLPLDVLKIHQLQVVRGTLLARQYQQSPFPLYQAEEFISLVAQYIQRLRPTLAIERFVSQIPLSMMLAPRWNIKPEEFRHQLVTFMRENGMFQGQLSHPSTILVKSSDIPI